jgi:hypothetical protein
MIRLISGLVKLALFAVILVFAIYNFELVPLRFANFYEFNLPSAGSVVFGVRLRLGTWIYVDMG